MFEVTVVSVLYNGLSVRDSCLIIRYDITSITMTSIKKYGEKLLLSAAGLRRKSYVPCMQTGIAMQSTIQMELIRLLPRS